MEAGCAPGCTRYILAVNLELELSVQGAYPSNTFFHTTIMPARPSESPPCSSLQEVCSALHIHSAADGPGATLPVSVHVMDCRL